MSPHQLLSCKASAVHNRADKCLQCASMLLQLSERVWKTRLHVVGEYSRDEAVYEITMVQRLGGRYGKHLIIAAAWQHLRTAAASQLLVTSLSRVLRPV
jgi:hypothetical protein